MRGFIFFITGILFFCSNTAFGQQAKAKRFTATLAGKVVLGDVPDKYSATVSSLEMPDPDASAEQKKLQEIKELIKRRFPRQKGVAQKTTSSVMEPTVALSFVADSIPGIPPDNYMAVSAGNKALSVINQTISVHDATTGAYLYRKGLNPFSASVGITGIVSDNQRYDPKVVYDPVADRFICVMLSGTNQYNWIVMAFSQSNDPTGGWNFYKFYGDYANDSTWFDYPAISITQNEFFLTGNKINFDSVSWKNGFERSVIYQVRKQDGYEGAASLTYQIWDNIQYNGQFLRCLYPLNPSDALLGPNQYFLSNRDFSTGNDTTFIVQVPDTIGSIDSIITVVPVVCPTSYGVPPDGRQPDTSLPLATNDNRILGGFIKDNEIQFVCTSVNPGNGNSAVYHGVIDNFTTTPVMAAQLFSIDTLDFGYPNISYAGTVGSSIQSIISFDYSGPGTYPGFGAIYYDGSNYSDMLNIISGDSTINMLGPGEQRWGDYSGSQPDWTTTGSVWVEGIFGKTNQQYGNYMAKLVSQYRTGVPVVLPGAATPSKLYPNPSFNFVSFDFNVAHQQLFSFIIYDARGREVEKILDNYCNEGRNVIQFNIAPLAPGTYFLKAVGTNGEYIPVHAFVRQ